MPIVTELTEEQFITLKFSKIERISYKRLQNFSR